ncbi:MAG: heme exporter protein CcmB [Cytophagales bacterium]
MFKEVFALMIKDFRLEWRNRYALNGILLYVFCTIFICYIAFEVKSSVIAPETWNTVFWIIMVFSAVNSIVKTFIQESSDRFYYYFQTCSPLSVIISKVFYNVFLMLLLSALAFLFYSLVLGNPLADIALFITTLLLGSLSFSIALSLISGIASKTGNASTLMVILGFPVIIPILLILIKLSEYALTGIENVQISNLILQLLGINLIMGSLTYLLFPYLWRS